MSALALIYIAYGSNLSHTQMASRCPGAEPGGKAILRDYTLGFPRKSPKREGCGVAGIRETPEAQIEVGLWHVNPYHMAALDKFEGVALHAYSRVQLSAFDEHGREISGFSYIANPQNHHASDLDYVPSLNYINTIIEGAHEFHFSAQSISSLESWRERARNAG